MPCSFDCPLRLKQKEVPYAGYPSAEIVLVGESPGGTEEKLGKPFMGRAGVLLTNNLLKAGINPDIVYFLNAMRCRLHKDDLSVKEINQLLANCRPHLERAISKLKPRVLVLLGDVALQQIARKKGISKLRGTLLWSDEFQCYLYPTYHPAFCLYKPPAEPILLEDFIRLKSLVDSNFNTEVAEFNIKEVESIQDVLDSDITMVSLDTETQGLDWTSPNSVLISYSIAYSPNSAYQVFIHERSDDKNDTAVYWKFKKDSGEEHYKKATNFDTKLNELRELLESPNIKKYMMNGNFDLHHIAMLYRSYNLPEPNVQRYVMDIQAAAHLIDENMYAQASLEQLRKSFTDINSDYSNDFELKFKKSNMLSVPKEDMTYYAGMDAIVTYQAAQSIRDKLLHSKRLANYLSKFLMSAISKTLYTIEDNGVMLDLAELPKSKEHIEYMADRLHKEAISYIPQAVIALQGDKAISLKRNALVKDVLFSKEGFGIEPPKLTKKNNVSVDNEARIKLDSKRIPKKARSFLDAYNLWTKYNKLHTTYIPNLTLHVKDDMRIHPHLSVTTTVTGRTSSRSPNLQNIPKRGELAPYIRRLLVAPPNKILMAFDASQAELRLCAVHSKDKKMVEIYKSGGDIHSTTALSILGKTRDQVSDEDFKNARRSAKITNFSFIYGGSPYGFQRQSKVEYGIDFTNEEAQNYMNAFFNTFPGVGSYHSHVKSVCRQRGYVESMLGRRRRLPEIKSDNYKIVNRAERQALNHAIQSMSSDLVIFACNTLLNDNLLDRNTIKLILFIHDEIIFEVDDTEEMKENYYHIIKHAMEHPPLKELFNIELSVPLQAECKVGYNLFDMKEYVP